MSYGILSGILAEVFSGFDLLKVLLTMNALVLTYIVYNQFRVTRNKLRLDLFEKRFAVFESTGKFIAKMVHETRPTLEDVFDYRESLREAEFLFEQDITEYLKAIDDKALLLWRIGEEMKGICDDVELKKVASAKEQTLLWLINQSRELPARLSPYLSFGRRL